MTTSGARPNTRCGLPYGGCFQCNPEQSRVVWAEIAAREAEKARVAKAQGRTPRRRPRTADEIAQLALPGIEEEFAMYPKHESDFAPTCPAEWDVRKTPKVAADMEARYKRVPACVKAETHRKNHPIKSWGWKYWDAVVALLEED
jgi:hypothetical protein